MFEIDKPMCDDIHNAGCHTWMHCHGKVGQLIGECIDMGIDVINPLEPPKNGDIILHEAVEKYGRAIGWEGNVEIQSILQADEETLKEEIGYCCETGKQVNRFILCPSAGFNEYVEPDERYINNLLTYINYGYEHLNS